MAKELIVATNPAKRRSSPKQRAAARRNIKKAQAANRKKGRRAPRKRRRNPGTAAAPSTRSPPRRNPTRRRRVPRGLKGIMGSQIIPAMVGGSGAVANDVLYGFIPLPDMLKVGPLRHVGKAATAILLGWAAGMVTNKRTADQLGAGALTVVGYNFVREIVGRFAPGIPMGEYLDSEMGYYGAGMDPGMGEYLDAGVGNIPGTGMSTSGQLTQGTPYMNGLGITWPTQFEEESYDVDEYGY